MLQVYGQCHSANKRMTKCKQKFRVHLNGSVMVLVSTLLCYTSGQNVPQSPCPNVFQYQYDGNEYFGLLALTGLRLGQTVRINMFLTLADALSTSYPGSLDLYESRDQTLQNVVNNRPILYKIRFPVQHVLPKVTHIYVNNILICSGQPDSGPLLTNIKLEHTLQTQLSQSLANNDPNYLVYGNDNSQGTNFNNINNADQGNKIGPQMPFQSDFYPQNGLMPSQFDQQSVPSATIRPQPSPRRPSNRPSAQAQTPTRRPSQQIQNMLRRPQAPARQEAETPYLTDDERLNNSLEDVNRVCGTIDPKFNVQPLVVGGEEIPRGSWPWLVAIYFNLPTSLAFQCGGSLITKKLVLTSAHCFFGSSKRYSAQDVIVFLGRYNIRNWNETGAVAAPADGVYIHPDYRHNKQTFDADIALVLLKNDVRFTDLIRPVCLWPTSSTTSEIEGTRGVVVGWGRNQAGQRTTSVPKRIETTIVSDLECLRSNEQFRVLTSNRTFCAGDRDGNGPCTGDSGGGLMLRRDNRWYLRGTVSASLSDLDRSSCNLNEYVIYVDVSKFLLWIKSYMQI